MPWCRSSFPRHGFLWSNIDSADWTKWGLCLLWYGLLVLPWIKYFRGVAVDRGFMPSLTGGNSFSEILHTVCNVALILANAGLFVPSRWLPEWVQMNDTWFFFLLMMIGLAATVYIPKEIVLSVRNIKKGRQQEFSPAPVSYWIWASVPFILAGVLIFLLWYFPDSSIVS